LKSNIVLLGILIVVLPGTGFAQPVSWEKIQVTAGIRNVQTFPCDPSALYIVGHSYVAITRNNGLNWKHIFYGDRICTEIPELEVDRLNSNNMFLSFPSVGILATNDGGESVYWMENGLTLNKATSKVEQSRSDPETYFVINNNHVHATSNSGRSWKRVDVSGVISAKYIKADVLHDSILYAFGQNILSKSTDRGANWRTIRNIGGLLFQSDNSGVLYYSNSRSTDFGETWISLKCINGANKGKDLDGLLTYCYSMTDSIIYIIDSQFGLFMTRDMDEGYFEIQPIQRTKLECISEELAESFIPYSMARNYCDSGIYITVNDRVNNIVNKTVVDASVKPHYSPMLLSINRRSVAPYDMSVTAISGGHSSISTDSGKSFKVHPAIRNSDNILMTNYMGYNLYHISPDANQGIYAPLIGGSNDSCLALCHWNNLLDTYAHYYYNGADSTFILITDHGMTVMRIPMSALLSEIYVPFIDTLWSILKMNGSIEDVEISLRTKKEIWLTVWKNDKSYIMKSINDGLSYTEVVEYYDNGISAIHDFLPLDDSGDGTILATSSGLKYVNETAHTYTDVHGPFEKGRPVEVLVRNHGSPTLLFAASASSNEYRNSNDIWKRAIYLTMDKGRRWMKVSDTGLFCGLITSMLYRDSDSVLFVATDAGLYMMKNPLQHIVDTTIDTTVTTYSNNQIFKDEDDLQIYPNPTAGLITLMIHDMSFQDRFASVEIYDMLGKTVYMKQLSNDDYSTTLINLSDYSPGIYLMKIYRAGRTYTKRICVQNRG
jgi:hypothetical protein